MRFLLVLVGALLFSGFAAAHSPGVLYDLSEVTMIDGARSVPLKDIAPGSRTQFGVPISKKYFSFSGRAAAIRTQNKTPVFEFIASPDSNISGRVYLLRFDVRSDRREIRMAKGSGGLAELRVPADHLMAASITAVGEGPNGTKRYRLTTNAPLRAGEYCLAQGITDFYDFGVD